MSCSVLLHEICRPVEVERAKQKQRAEGPYHTSHTGIVQLQYQYRFRQTAMLAWPAVLPAPTAFSFDDSSLFALLLTTPPNNKAQQWFFV
jgi:hypothetical protein